MTITRRVAYEINTCPRCGEPLAAPDDDLNRHCFSCGVTVLSSTVTIDVAPDHPAGLHRLHGVVEQ